MVLFAEPLSYDFDGNPVEELEALVNRGLSDPRHLQRVQALTELVRDEEAPAEHRFQACFALTSWAERAGYLAVQDAAADPYEVPWYGVQIDRFFSVDNTYAFLASAIDTSSLIVDKKGTQIERGQALRALINIADKVYYDSKLTYTLDPDIYEGMLVDIAAAIKRGIAALAGGHRPKFDLATQLVDLTVAMIDYDEDQAVQLATELVQLAPSPRVMVHAVRVVEVGREASSQTFGEYLNLIGDSGIRQRVAVALPLRDRYR